MRGMSITTAVMAAMSVAIHATAQETQVRGRVVDAARGTPLVAVQVATVDAEGRASAGALTDASGAFGLVPPPGTESLLFSSLGYLDRSVPVAVIGRYVDIRLSPRPFELEALEAASEGRCGDRALAETPALARLWLGVIGEYGRTRGQGADTLLFGVQEHQRTLSPDGKAVWDERVGTSVRRAERAFVGFAPPPEGTVRFIREAGDSVVFLGPDDRFLGSEAFQEQFCLEAVDERERGRLGLRFRPRDEGDLVGTFWLAFPGLALQELELVYRDPRWRGRDREATGTLGFRALADGRTVVASWGLRIPEVEVRERPGVPDLDASRIHSIREFGGRLLTAVTADGTTVFEAGAGVVAGRVVHEDGSPVDADTRVRVVGSPIETRTDEEGGFRLPPIPAGLYTLRTDGGPTFAEVRVDVRESSTLGLRLEAKAPSTRRVEACSGPGVWVRLDSPSTVPPGTPVSVRPADAPSFGTLVDLDQGITICGLDGPVELLVPGHEPVRATLAASGPTEARLRPVWPLREAPFGWADVRVVDRDSGEPMSGAAVFAGSSAGTTGEDGVVSLPVGTGEVELRVDRPGSQPFHDRIEVAYRARSGFDIRLARDPLRLRVTDPSGARAAGLAGGLGPRRLELERPLGLESILARAGYRMRARAPYRAGAEGETLCHPLVVEDGIRRSPPAGSGAGPYPLGAWRIERIAVLVIDAEAGPCGTISAWLRDGTGGTS